MAPAGLDHDRAGPARPPPEHSPRRLNRLAAALDARTYLEIGVATGATFRAVHVADRTGVDPHFRFDLAAVVDESTHLFAATSDELFATMPPEQTFDLCLVDGLHTFEQTYRDVCNCLAHAHARSVWLVDDTVPSDEYSAIPDQRRALAARRAAGKTGQAWHGDVFKVVFAIHDFHPDLQYSTIVGSGNPQTLVWRRPGGGRGARRQPLFGSLDRISRLTYADLRAHWDVLHRCREDVAIRRCLAGLGVPAADP